MARTVLRAPVAGALAAVLLAGALGLVWGTGLANYDALYTLVWGRELAGGAGPSYDVTLAPTPHPLAELAGLALAALDPRTAEDVLVVAGFLALGAVGWLTFRLGAAWFGAPAGLLAAAIVLTREPVLSYGTRAYVDLPHLALCLAALLLVVRRPSAPAAPLALLALAGLIRPEAWLFALALLAWSGHRTGTVRPGWVALALAGPVGWAAFDLVTTGDALHSLTGTRENAGVLARTTGLDALPATLPRRVGEILREPVLAGAALGAGLALWRLRARALLPAAAAGLAALAFAVLALAGLPLLTRYAFGVAVLGAVFCGAGAFGWRELPRTDPWRRRWAVAGALVLVALAVSLPGQLERLDRTRDTIALQARVEDDLWDLRLPDGCGRAVGTVNHRLVPLVALKEDLDPGAVRPAPLPPGFRGVYLEPASGEVARAFVLDPRDPSERVTSSPRRFVPAGGNASWRVLRRC